LPGQPARHAPDVETLTRDALGYALPVSGLVWWVRAQAAPTSPVETTLQADGRLAQLRQYGWTIDYLQYRDDGLPRKLSASRDGMDIRLVADSWGHE
jgi:outer membrane lipoprotein LolB